MKKLDIRFCERNLTEEGTDRVSDHIRDRYPEMANVKHERCLGNCSVCNQGPYCTVNDFLFQRESSEAFLAYIESLLQQLQVSLNERRKKKTKEPKGDRR